MKRAFIVLFVFLFFFSACAPGVSSAIPAPTQDKADLTAQTAVPASTVLSTPTAILSPIPDTLYVNPSQSLGSISGEATSDSHFNAIWLGDVLGRMIKNGVFIAKYRMLTSKGG